MSTRTPEVIQSEIDALKEEYEAAKAHEGMPKPLPNPDFQKVIDNVVGHIEEMAGGRYDDDCKEYIFEAAMTAVYGDGVWAWYGERGE